MKLERENIQVQINALKIFVEALETRNSNNTRAENTEINCSHRGI